jgi:hypothetical protein
MPRASRRSACQRGPATPARWQVLPPSARFRALDDTLPGSERRRVYGARRSLATIAKCDRCRSSSAACPLRRLPVERAKGQRSHDDRFRRAFARRTMPCQGRNVDASKGILARGASGPRYPLPRGRAHDTILPRARMLARALLFACVRRRARTRAHAHTRTHTRARARTRAHAHAHARSRAHTRTHTRARARRRVHAGGRAYTHIGGLGKPRGNWSGKPVVGKHSGKGNWETLTFLGNWETH